MPRLHIKKPVAQRTKHHQDKNKGKKTIKHEKQKQTTSHRHILKQTELGQILNTGIKMRECSHDTQHTGGKKASRKGTS